MPLVCASGTQGAAKRLWRSWRSIQEPAGVYDLQIWAEALALRAVGLMIAGVPGGITGERVPYYRYSDPFCFERFVRWGFLQGCLCTPAKSLPRAWGTAKCSAKMLGFCLCAAAFACSGFSVIWPFPSPTILENGKLT